MYKTLPLFKFPTTIIWIDDDDVFLKATKFVIPSINRQKQFNHPLDFKNYLKSYKSPLSKIAFLQAERDNENYNSLKHVPIDFDVDSIAHLYSYKERLNEISLIICDHEMPAISGLDLCYQLQDFSFKKILLTGEVENQEAIHAFNHGIIDRFIRKDNPELLSEVRSYIELLEQEYFCEVTSPLLVHLKADGDNALTDPVFIAFFDKWCKENRITEYYLIDKRGSFLVINEQQEAHYFVLHTDQSLDQFTGVCSDFNEAQDYLKLVTQRARIPFFGCGREAWQVDIKTWSECFYRPNIFKGRVRYYWALI